MKKKAEPIVQRWEDAAHTITEGSAPALLRTGRAGKKGEFPDQVSLERGSACTAQNQESEVSALASESTIDKPGRRVTSIRRTVRLTINSDLPKRHRELRSCVVTSEARHRLPESRGRPRNSRRSREISERPLLAYPW